VALPEEAEEHRREIAAFLARYDVAGDEERTALLADSGYLFPHWPRPWGRDAGPVEQLVVESELASRVRRPFMGLAGWCAASIVAYGSREQQERWVRPTLRGEASWCQLFSEPEAGSDLAAVRTRATRVEKGWRLTGQKVWTSMAHRATSGLCLARTDPDAPKHRGLSIFVVDMRAPGVQVRPLRELTGHPTFNEVFLDDVALSEDAIIGQPGQGWEIARTTLANERVSMGGATTTGDTAVAHALLDLLDHSEPDDARRVEDVGQLIAEHRALDLLAARRVERALVGANPGPESSVAKLLGSEHEQRVADCAMEILGPAGSVDSGVAAPWFHKFLFSRVLTIAGGTSQVLRNVIAERVLGLPRDP
jgi:alkylation response protein AidB-like acyl-CoA dehydrogenase